MLTPLDIKEIMIEITSNCQAMCLDCGRNLDGVKLNPNLQFGTAGNMKFETFKSVFNKKVLPNFDKTHFDGNFGDSMIHPESLEFVKYLAKEFPGSRIEINTNGGYHDPEYWYEMGQITSKNFRNDEQVLFGIDGIDNETHDKYRRNVKYDRIIENATAFIKGGGKAVWKYLEFDHNAHQVDEAKQLAKKMGFVHFFVKSTRWRSKAILGETTISGSASKKHDETQISTIPKTQQDYVNKIQTNLKKFKDFTNECVIECPWLARQRVQIEYDGRVWQCCHLSGKYGSGTGFSMRDYEYYVNKHGTDWNNINTNSLQDILRHPYWNDLHDSFNKNTADSVNPRIRRCADKCGQGLE